VLVRRFAISAILAYKKNVSPFCLQAAGTIKLFEYTLIAVRNTGSRGTWMGMGRILRCNPFSEGGFDR